MHESPFRALASLRHLIWMCQPFRAFVSMGLIVCMVFSLMPLGCHSAQVRHVEGQSGQGYIPEVTAERLKLCGTLVQEDIEPGRHPMDAKVELNENGRVVGVTTTGAPNPDVAMCLRGTLRDMQVDKVVFEEAALRTRSSANAETIPNRAYMGQVETIVEITVIFVEVVILEEALVGLEVSVTATAEASVIKALQAHAAQANARQAGTPRGTRKPHQPNVQKWSDNGGSIYAKADGTTTYTRADGVSVTYDKDGFPDLTPYRHPTVKDVQIEFTGSYPKDNALADKAAGITEKMRDDGGYTWHHHQDKKTMQLIKKDVHKDFVHTGGMAGTRK